MLCDQRRKSEDSRLQCRARDSTKGLGRGLESAKPPLVRKWKVKTTILITPCRVATIIIFAPPSFLTASNTRPVVKQLYLLRRRTVNKRKVQLRGSAGRYCNSKYTRFIVLSSYSRWNLVLVDSFTTHERICWWQSMKWLLCWMCFDGIWKTEVVKGEETCGSLLVRRMVLERQFHWQYRTS